jgi:hypothetical protein
MARPKGTTGVKQLTVEDRQRVRTLYFDGQKLQSQIRQITSYTKAQIRHTVRSDSAAIGARPGRPPVLSLEQTEELVAFVRASKENRRMSFLKLSVVLFDGAFGIWAIKNTLYRLGYRRRAARKKPPITETNRLKRL